jgi:hypothetical protein
MSEMRIIAFDSTPVDGGAGVRTAIIERADGTFIAKGRRPRRLPSDEMKRLIEEGFVTRIEAFPIDTELHDGVVAYRHRNFVLPGLDLHDEQVWRPSGDVHVAYLATDNASSLFERHARAAHILASATLARRRLDDANRLARRGLMVTPGLRQSQLAARLYGVLLAAASLGESSEAIRREIEVMLDASRVAEAVRAAADELFPPKPNVVDARRLDRGLAVGSPDAPREAA